MAEGFPDHRPRTKEEVAGLLGRLRITDVHVHVQPWDQMRPDALEKMRAGRGDLKDIPRLFSEPRAFLDHLDASGVWRAGLINYVAPEVMGFSEEVNRYMADFCREDPDRLIPFGGVDPRVADDLPDRMDRMIQEHRIRGFKIHPPHQGYPPNAYVTGEVPGLATVYEKAQEAGLVVMVHTGTSVFPRARNRLGDPILVDDVAVDFPDLKIILAHGGRPIWMEAAVFVARRFPNVYLEVSSLPPQRLLDYFPRLERMAPKVLFGTDWPAPAVVSIRRNLELFATLPLADETLEQILQTNPDKIFGDATMRWPT